jgi:hypothetical protein
MPQYTQDTATAGAKWREIDLRCFRHFIGLPFFC